MTMGGSWIGLQVLEPNGESSTPVMRAQVRSIHPPMSPRELYRIGVNWNRRLMFGRARAAGGLAESVGSKRFASAGANGSGARAGAGNNNLRACVKINTCGSRVSQHRGYGITCSLRVPRRSQSGWSSLRINWWQPFTANCRPRPRRPCTPR